MRFMIAFSHTATCKCRCQPSCCRGTLVVTVIGCWRLRFQPVTAHRFAAEHVSPRCLPTGEGRQRHPQPRRRWQPPILHDLQIGKGSIPISTKICTCDSKWWPTRRTVRFFWTLFFWAMIFISSDRISQFNPTHLVFNKRVFFFWLAWWGVCLCGAVEPGSS